MVCDEGKVPYLQPRVDAPAAVGGDNQTAPEEGGHVGQEVVVLGAVSLEGMDASCEGDDILPVDLPIDELPSVADVGGDGEVWDHGVVEALLVLDLLEGEVLVPRAQDDGDVKFVFLELMPDRLTRLQDGVVILSEISKRRGLRRSL